MSYRNGSWILLLTGSLAAACSGHGRDVAEEVGAGGNKATASRGGAMASTVGGDGSVGTSTAGGEGSGGTSTVGNAAAAGNTSVGNASAGNASAGNASAGNASAGSASAGNASAGTTNGGTDSKFTSRTRLSGALQKGPFVLGSSVLLSPLNAEGISSGALYSTQTVNNLGEFQFELEYAGPVSIEGSGFYYNEVSGTLSTAPITLRALFNLGGERSSSSGAAGNAGGSNLDGAAGAGRSTSVQSQSAYVNLITHLAYFRVKALVASGSNSVASAIAEAEAEVRTELGIGPSTLDLTVPATTMNLLGGDTLANAYSFAVGTVLAQAAARRTGPIDANLQELLNSIASDLAEDGVLSASLKQELKSAIAAVDTKRVMDALAARLTSLGSTATVPNLDRIIDSDFDGAVNAEDCMRRDPLRWTAHADLDGDGHIHVDCGGDDCDDDNPNRYVGNPELCDGSVDNDCDGSVDNGCPCPGSFGPTMVRLPRNYCIDSTEVTRSQYQAWLDTIPPITGQTAHCELNASYAPDPICMLEASVCQGASCGNHPQVCVDWCDAYAFCRAAGKRLCGAIGGGPLNFSAENDSSAATNQWYSACSSNGAYRFPYGGVYSSTVCNHYAPTTVPVGSLPGCQSPSARYAGIFDMSGNVYEWLDTCSGDTAGSCYIEGGSYSFGRDQMYASCSGMPLAYSYDFVREDLGFRCCAP